MSCIACHSAWNPSCFGCHLPQRANKKMPQLHNEGDVTRNYVSYNFQTLRDDVFMLARDGNATANRIGPARSSCAIHVGSYNANRESIYVQQQTISGDGMSGIAFSTNVPHTVRGGPPVVHDPSTPRTPSNGRPPNPGAYLPGHSDTKTCTDCHLSKTDDNNAIMAQLLMQGTNYVNFIGRYCWVAAGDHGLAAVVVTERDEPQAVIGSSLHQLAYPDDYRKHLEAGGKLEARARALRPRRRRAHPPARDPVDPGARRVPLRRLRRVGSAGLRHRVHRPQGLLRANRDGAGLSAGPAVLRAHLVRHGGRRAHDDRPGPDAPASARATTSSPSTRCTATSTSPTATRA